MNKMKGTNSKKYMLPCAVIIISVALAMTVIIRSVHAMTAKSSLDLIIAYLALNKSQLSTESALIGEIKKVMPPDTIIDHVKHKDEQIYCTIDGRMCFIDLMSAPIPWTWLEGPCATSWMWDEATAKMKAHKDHLFISVHGDKTQRLENALLLTKIMAAAIRCHDSAGVYWGDGTLVIEPKMFVDEALEAGSDNLPVQLWIEFRVQRNEDMTINIITTGLKAFHCMEIEILHSKKEIMQLVHLAWGTADILLKGEKISDGDTVGLDEKTRLKVTHEKSLWDRPDKVLRIHI
jgi:hypothetical protein